MTISRNTRLAAGATVVVALAAAGAAVAAGTLKGGGHVATAGSQATLVSSGSGTAAAPQTWHRFGGRDGFRGGPLHGGDDLAAAASYLGITQDDLVTQLGSGKTLRQIANATNGKSAAGLIDALVAQEKTELAQAVSDGRLTQTQADEVEQSLKQRVTDRVDHTRPVHGPGGPGFGGHGRSRGDDLAAAATYLGLTQDALLADLEGGKTLAQVADATSGKSKAGLVAALVAHEKAELAQAVQNGRLTQAQADQAAQALEQRVTSIVDGTFPPHRDGPPTAPPSGGAPVQPQHI
jgi:hypothetical protein